MNLVIGLTGGIASGKTTASTYLKEKGYQIIDCDKISHDVLLDKQVIKQIVDVFGSDVVVSNNISRELLGAKVFNNKILLNKLNEIIHPVIYNKVKSEIKEGIVFIDCPLLFETNFINLCDKTLVIYVNKDIQVDRLISRSNLSNEEALNRIALQMSLDEKKEKCDYLIENNLDKSMLFNELDNLINILERE